MKHIFHHPAEKLTGRKYWRSLGELSNTDEFRGWLDREFPAGAAELKLDGVSRRNFLKLMGASTALAGFGLAGCRQPKSLVPFTRSSEWEIPGKALFFATAMPRRTGAMPLVVTTHDGRPTKIEGNPLHPVGKGATDVFAQGSILGLYDPERARFFREEGGPSDVATFNAFLDGVLSRMGDGSGVAILAEENNSPTRERIRAEVQKRYPKLLWSVYEPLGNDLSNAANKAAFGEGVRAVPVLEKADVVLTLDADFLGTEIRSLTDVRAFADRRRVEKPGDKMNRLYTVENRYTVTGGMADHRLRIPASQIGHFAVALALELGISTAGIELSGKVKFPDGWIKELAADLKASQGRSLVLVGNRQPVAVQQLGYAINHALGNIGSTLVGAPVETAPAADLAELNRQINASAVRTLFILGGNPVYNAPVDFGWNDISERVGTIIHLTESLNETSNVARWVIPGAHYLEGWSDGIAADGSYLSIQPLLLPLYDGWTELDLLARLAGLPKPKGSELVQETFRARVKPSDFNTAWNQFLRDGFVANKDSAPSIAFSGAIPTRGLLKAADESSIEVVFPADSKMEDGRYNNNGWMQELPDPITKTTWDNVAWISPKTAKEFNLGQNLLVSSHDVIEISLADGNSVKAAVFIVPGHADNSLSLSLGWGREVVGKIGKGTGVSAYRLRTSAAPYIAVGAKITKLEETKEIAHTQEHFSMEGRGLVREATLAEFNANPGFVKTMGGDSHVPPDFPSLYPHPKLGSPEQWGMAIDLNTCIGCTTCTVSCQAENNIPVVGKEQVIMGRSMHWMRNDRYFVSDTVEHQDMGQYPSDPEMVFQPMLCQHCENAPCETVCPVNATVHTQDGLNVMAYNRCIGTRYCANNCPFKVRRFNFFDYTQRPITPVKVPILGEVNGLKLGPLTEKGTPDTIKMQKNPNVTVRMRGVMEKCSFCTQRIQEARIGQKVKAGGSADIKIPVDSFTSACAQSCPTGAIVFGDITDPESRVSKLREQEKNYRLLNYLNVKTRVSYLARLRNPNPKMPDAKQSASQPEHAHS